MEEAPIDRSRQKGGEEVLLVHCNFAHDVRPNGMPIARPKLSPCGGLPSMTGGYFRYAHIDKVTRFVQLSLLQYSLDSSRVYTSPGLSPALKTRKWF